MIKVFVIVLNFNGGRDIVECLNSLKGEEGEIVVVDNGSFDNSLTMIKKNFPKVKIIKNNKNLGFAAGNNIGIRYASKQGADAVVLLNQDTIVEKDFLDPLLKNQADIVGPVIKFKRGGKWIYDYGGKIHWLIGRTSHQESLTCFNSGRSPRGLNFQDPDYISGCAMLIRRPVFEKIGFLDERLFLYFEDVDFCLRATRAGFKIAVESDSMIFHKLDGGERKSLSHSYHLLRSNLIFINRYISFWKRPLGYLYWWALSIKTLLLRFYDFRRSHR